MQDKLLLRSAASLCAGALAALPLCSVPAAGEDDISAVITTTDGDRVSVELNEKMFLQDSRVYHHDIGMLTVALASCAYNNSSTSGQGKYIADAYKELGFADDKTALFSYSAADGNNPYGISEMEGDSQAFAIASRKLGDTTLLSVTLRGTDATVDEDVQTDLISALAVPYLGNLAGSGFAEFSKKVSRGLAAYIENEPEIAQAADEDSLKIVVTGHSLGAAGANLLGTYLDSGDFKLGKVSQDDIFVYTYACPTTCAEVSAGTDYSNIINIMNRSDIVTELPGNFLIDVDVRNGEVRYAEGFAAGQKRIFDSHETKSILDWSGHHPDRYIKAAQEELKAADLDVSRLEGGYSPLLANTAARLCQAASGDEELALQALGDVGCAPESCQKIKVGSDSYFLGLAPNGGGSLLVIAAAESSGETWDSQKLADEIELYLAERSLSGGVSIFAAGEGVSGGALGFACRELTGSGIAEKAYGCLYDPVSGEESETDTDIFCITDISRLCGENGLPDASLLAGMPGKCALVSGADSFSGYTETHLSAEAPPIVEKDAVAVTVSGRVYAEVTREGKVVGKAVEPGESRDMTPVPVIEAQDTQLILLPGDGSCQLTLTGRSAGGVDFSAQALSGGGIKAVSGAVMEPRKVMRFAPEKGQAVTEAKLLVLDDEGKPVLEVLSDGSEVKYREHPVLPFAAAGGVLAAGAAAAGTVAVRRKKNAEK